MDKRSRRQALSLSSLGIMSLITGFVGTRPSHAVDRGDRLPEFQGIETWLNSEPLSLADLQGKVVGVQFWTLGCINSQRTLPHTTALYSKYKDQGFVLVGVHTPEFPYEHEINNIEAAIEHYGIEYPVAVDNEFKTWRAYNNRYWPHLFVAGRSGRIAFHRIGEGGYSKIDEAVGLLVSEAS